MEWLPRPGIRDPVPDPLPIPADGREAAFSQVLNRQGFYRLGDPNGRGRFPEL